MTKSASQVQKQPKQKAAKDELDLPKNWPDAKLISRLESYIHGKWEDLTRPHSRLFQGMLDDEKVPHKPDADPILYISDKEHYMEVKGKLDKVRESLKGHPNLPEISLRTLPKPYSEIEYNEHGLLYLPHPYMVPGGRFNETYGWDSAFIVRGLVHSGELDLAKAEVENKLYSIEHYGTILNANRSYYLQRSQAPLLTQMVLDIFRNYDKLKDPEIRRSTDWLKAAIYPTMSFYDYWVNPPYLHGPSGLSYYNDLNDTPAIEVSYSEPGHYTHALTELRSMAKDVAGYKQSEPDLSKWTYQQRKDAYYTDLLLTHPDEEGERYLSPRFYRGDRAMRASGFDPSRRFGYFNVDIIYHLPVCLNTLLYVMEHDIAAIARILSRAARDGRLKDDDADEWARTAKRWQKRALRRKSRINEWLWDEGDENTPPGYRDYHFETAQTAQYHLPSHRNYNFATAFYPLWAGIASEEQAAAVVKHVYPRLITKNGLMSSDRETGCQWDAPFAWAPLQVLAVRGLMRYGYTQEALAIAKGFLGTIAHVFDETGLIFEKYDTETGSHKTGHKIDKGYNTNVEGFGWTNACALEFLDLLRQHGYDG